ncbi:MAG: biotin--[acetyl-CoA-carboxylase] ligase [Pedosphaera sp.]|nr:biotin--[acetyl-CoA-carboxylase] ligase [Pedosphaera sp.]
MTLDTQIIAALRSRTDGVASSELCSQLGITRAAIWARIESLRNQGYEIVASPHIGYRLVRSPDKLNADDLRSQIAPKQIIGRELRVLEQTTSTNDEAERLARTGAPEGLAVFAESQTKGRGRLGRSWSSPPRKGVWVSVLLRPPFSPAETTRLTVMSAVSVARTIRLQTELKPEIKWPNDILIKGRKTAGILTEMQAEMDHVNYVILGIGLDVNQSAADFSTELKPIATSLRIESGRAFNRADIALTLLREIDSDYRRLCAGKFADIAEEWEGLCTTIGREITVTTGNHSHRGRAESLDPTGALLLRTEFGRLERIIGGDVSVHKKR